MCPQAQELVMIQSNYTQLDNCSMAITEVRGQLGILLTPSHRPVPCQIKPTMTPTWKG